MGDREAKEAYPMEVSPSTLTRQGTRSTKRELLEQIRGAVNPYQAMHNRILIVQAVMVTAAVIMLVVFAILANMELNALKNASKDEIIPNLEALMVSLDRTAKEVQVSYAATMELPLLTEMYEQAERIEGNLSVTVYAMTTSSMFAGVG